MTPERWRRVEEVFAGTEGLSATQIRAYLERECAGDTELRKEVQSMLSYESSESALFDQIVEEGAEALAEITKSHQNPAHRRVGTRIGPYRLVSLIGTGGMGAVYLAARDDQQYQKNVAIKLVQQGHDTKFVLERFRQERQILAQLEHPYIARFLEGGLTDEKLPYYVMEYIEGGESITSYCQNRQLPIEARLRLFLQVCSAVDFAHKNLVVHRDLKPTNILVDRHGTPKLLDFGIAKVLSDDSRGTDTTMTAVRMLTPDYGSPEQVTGNPITTSTDVYSLGAVLYELLSGAQAHRFRNYSTGEIQRVICIEDPPPPSERAREVESAESSRLSASLRGDLDSIALQALRKEPSGRYASVSALVRDIEHYLNGEPVEARRGTLRYRAGKFVRKNKFSISAAAVLLVTLISGIAATTYQARRSERRFQLARQLGNTLLNDFDKRVVNLPQSTGLRQWMTSTVVEYLDNLASEAGQDTQLQFELAGGYMRVGGLQSGPSSANLGQSIPALASYRKALGIYSELHQAAPKDAAVNMGLCDAMTAVAQIETYVGKMKQARQRYQEARVIGEALVPVKEGEGRRCLSRIYGGLVEIELAAANPRGAIPSITAQLEQAKQWAATDPGLPSKVQLLSTEISLANVKLDVGDAQGAVDTASQAMVQGEATFGREAWAESSYKILLHHVLGDAMGHARHLNLGRPEEALKHYQAALEIAERHLKRDDNDARARRDVDLSLRKIAFMIVDTQPRAAMIDYRRAKELSFINLRNSPSNAEYVRDQADALLGIGYAFQSSKHWPEALESIQYAFDRQNDLKRLSPEWRRFQREFQESFAALGDVHMELGNEKATLENYEKALETTVALLWEQPTDALLLRDLADSHECLARYYAWMAERHASEGSSYWKQAIDFQQKSYDTWREWPTKVSATSVYAQKRLQDATTQLAAYRKAAGVR